jgi:hypothetical protein
VSTDDDAPECCACRGERQIDVSDPLTGCVPVMVDCRACGATGIEPPPSCAECGEPAPYGEATCAECSIPASPRADLRAIVNRYFDLVLLIGN